MPLRQSANVRDLRTVVRAIEKMRTNVTLDAETGCLLWQGSCVTRGYGAVYIIGKQWMAHRLAWELNKGPIPHGGHVLHRCDTPACINPDHLFIGDQEINMRDMARKGRHRGVRKTKLAHDVVRQIRIDPRRPSEIALDYAISESYVSAIKTRRCLFWIE